jgi:rhodanese-related sulfurtransferase
MFTPIDRVELLRLMEDESAQVVNVLPAGEYQRERIPGSINIPLKGLDEQTTRVLSRSKPVVVY